jgi:hypothetical protein
MRTLTAVGLGGAVFVLSACGGSDQPRCDKSAPQNCRPPEVLSIGASISPRGVSLSPDSLGAGPVRITVTNQTPESRAFVLKGAANAQTPCISGPPVNTGPINPQGVTQVQVVLVQGTCSAETDPAGPRAAKLEVGKQRPSAQNQVLLP